MQTVLVFIIGLFFGSLTAYFAQQRGRNPVSWFLVGFFFGLLGFLILFLFPSLAEKEEVLEHHPPIEVEPALSHGYDNKPWYYLSAEGKQVGPIDYEDLRKLWDQNLLTIDTFVWCDGMENWKKIEELNLFSE